MVFDATQFVYVTLVFEERTSLYLMLLILICDMLWLKLIRCVSVGCSGFSDTVYTDVPPYPVIQYPRFQLSVVY
jgi:hypothetical protein